MWSRLSIIATFFVVSICFVLDPSRSAFVIAQSDGGPKDSASLGLETKSPKGPNENDGEAEFNVVAIALGTMVVAYWVLALSIILLIVHFCIPDDNTVEEIVNVETNVVPKISTTGLPM